MKSTRHDETPRSTTSPAHATPRRTPRREALRQVAAIGTAIGSAMLPATAALVAPRIARAQEIRERSIKLAFVNTAESAHGKGAERLAQVVAERSNGKLKIKPYPGGTLGGEAAVASSLQGGIIEMSMMGPGLLTGADKEFGVFDTPFLFDTYAQVDAALDGPVGKRLLERLPARGIVGLSYWDHGFRILSNSRRPIARLEDLQGLKIRVQQIPVFIETFNALGTNAVPLPFTELFSALETHTVDGQENPFVSIEVTKFYDVQKYATDTRHAYSPLVVMCSRKFWDKLSADEQQVLRSSCEDVRDYQRRTSREMDAKAAETIQTRGMTVTRLTADERKRMRDRVQPVIDKHLQGVGQIGKDMLEAVASVRG